MVKVRGVGEEGHPEAERALRGVFDEAIPSICLRLPRPRGLATTAEDVSEFASLGANSRAFEFTPGPKFAGRPMSCERSEAILARYEDIIAQHPEIPRFARNDPSGQIATTSWMSRDDFVRLPRSLRSQAMTIISILTPFIRKSGRGGCLAKKKPVP